MPMMAGLTFCFWSSIHPSDSRLGMATVLVRQCVSRDYLKTFLSGTPKLGAFGAQVSIDLKTMLPPSPIACPEIMYGRYCSLGVWLSKYPLTSGAQLTISAVLSSVHQTALKLKGWPPIVTPEMIENDPSLPVAIVLNSSTLNTSQRLFWLSSRNLQASASQVRCTR